MKQAALNLDLSVKKARKQVFLAQMDKVVPWAALVDLIAPYYPRRKDWQATVFASDHAAHPLLAAMARAV